MYERTKKGISSIQDSQHGKNLEAVRQNGNYLSRKNEQSGKTLNIVFAHWA